MMRASRPFLLRRVYCWMAVPSAVLPNSVLLRVGMLFFPEVPSLDWQATFRPASVQAASVVTSRRRASLGKEFRKVLRIRFIACLLGMGEDAKAGIAGG